MTTFDSVKDSGERRSFDTGSVRDVRTGKGRYDLIPPVAIKRIAQHFENGAVKYGDRNWELGQPLSSYLDSGLRHTYNLLELKVDEDHASAGIWNLIAFLCTADWIIDGRLPRELDDIGYCDALEEAREDGDLDEVEKTVDYRESLAEALGVTPAPLVDPDTIPADARGQRLIVTDSGGPDSARPEPGRDPADDDPWVSPAWVNPYTLTFEVPKVSIDTIRTMAGLLPNPDPFDGEVVAATPRFLASLDVIEDQRPGVPSSTIGTLAGLPVFTVPDGHPALRGADWVLIDSDTFQEIDAAETLRKAQQASLDRDQSGPPRARTDWEIHEDARRSGKLPDPCGPGCEAMRREHEVLTEQGALDRDQGVNHHLQEHHDRVASDKSGPFADPY